jgi:hypothetical protein
MNTAVDRLPDDSAATIPSLREADCTRLLIERTCNRKKIIKNLDKVKIKNISLFHPSKGYFYKAKAIGSP